MVDVFLQLDNAVDESTSASFTSTANCISAKSDFFKLDFNDVKACLVATINSNNYTDLG